MEAGLTTDHIASVALRLSGMDMLLTAQRNLKIFMVVDDFKFGVKYDDYVKIINIIFWRLHFAKITVSYFGILSVI